MRMHSVTIVALALTLSTAPLFAQASTDNQDARKVARAQARIDHKADHEAAKLSTGNEKKAFHAQSKADKQTAKALNTRSAKKAAKAQDKANDAAVKALTPQ